MRDYCFGAYMSGRATLAGRPSRFVLAHGAGAQRDTTYWTYYAGLSVILARSATCGGPELAGLTNVVSLPWVQFG